MKYGLSKSTIQKICTVLARYPQVERAVLYGSRVMGTYDNGSDIDMTLCGGFDLTLSVHHKIADELDDLLLPYTIDLSIFRDINNPKLVKHIQAFGVPLYERKMTCQNK